MKRFLALMVAAGLALAGCAGGEAQPVASVQSAGHTIEIATATGKLQNGPNDLTVSFRDASGQPVEVQSPVVRFHMPAEGAMAAMNAQAPLNATDKPGVYAGQVNLEMKGGWQTTVAYQDKAGPQQATLTMTAQ